MKESAVCRKCIVKIRIYIVNLIRNSLNSWFFLSSSAIHKKATNLFGSSTILNNVIQISFFPVLCSKTNKQFFFLIILFEFSSAYYLFMHQTPRFLFLFLFQYMYFNTIFCLLFKTNSSKRI